MFCTLLRYNIIHDYKKQTGIVNYYRLYFFNDEYAMHVDKLLPTSVVVCITRTLLPIYYYTHDIAYDILL